MYTRGLSTRLYRAFSSGWGYANPKAAPKTSYSPSVNDKLVWINIENFGKFERIAAIEGESMLDAL